jgi:hypothetical protein
VEATAAEEEEDTRTGTTAMAVTTPVLGTATMIALILMGKLEINAR